MTKIIIRKAILKDLDWINQQYAKVDFVPSKFEHELIAIAESNGQKCGIGRIVSINKNDCELGGIYVLDDFRGQGVARDIVHFLLEHKSPTRHTYCLPFAHLLNFYQSFGFISCSNFWTVPEEIKKKHLWCNEKYEHKTLLLVLEK